MTRKPTILFKYLAVSVLGLMFTVFPLCGSLLVAGSTVATGTTAIVPLSFNSETGNTAGLEWTVTIPGATVVSLQLSPGANNAAKLAYCNGSICLIAGMTQSLVPTGVIGSLVVSLPLGVGNTLPVHLSNVSEALADGTAGVITSIDGSISVSAPASPRISSLQCPPSTLSAGQTTGCVVTLTAQPPVAGTAIQFSSSSPAVTLPASTIVTGISLTVPVTAGSGIHTGETVTISASYNGSTASASLTVQNLSPVVSSVTVSAITSSGAVISWNTDEPSNSLVAYGTDTTYSAGSQSELQLVTQHSIQLQGLEPSTAYQYQARSTDSQGNVGSSANLTFTTSSAELLHIEGARSEFSGMANGAVITPVSGPPGFTGTLMIKGSGSAVFESNPEEKDALYFLACCGNVNTGYLKFTGTPLAKIFGNSEGEISFTLRSRHTFTDRHANAVSPRYSFDVRDGNGKHLFDFLTQVDSKGLQFTYTVRGFTQFYYVRTGMEDKLFGNGVEMTVRLVWTETRVTLYLNGHLKKSSACTPAPGNWTAASNFDLGAYEYGNLGGYNVSDDAIRDFWVTDALQESSASAASVAEKQ